MQLAPKKIHEPSSRRRVVVLHLQSSVPPCKPQLVHATLKVPTCHWKFASSRRSRRLDVVHVLDVILQVELASQLCYGLLRRKLLPLDVEWLHDLDVQGDHWASVHSARPKCLMHRLKSVPLRASMQNSNLELKIGLLCLHLV